MTASTLTTARAAAERLAREIQDRDLAGLMPTEIREHTRMQQLIEQACDTILDECAPDTLVCGCADDLVGLLISFDRDGILFDRSKPERLPRLLRRLQIHGALTAAAHQLGLMQGKEGGAR